MGMRMGRCPEPGRRRDVQIHGGVAIPWEHDVQMYSKRAHATSQFFGQPHEHRRRLAELFKI